MDDGADRHRTQLHRVARLDVDLVARNHRIADRQTLRRHDVGKLAVLVLDKGDERRTARIELQPLDQRRHAMLGALEIDDAIALLVAAAAPAHGDAAGVVAATFFGQAFGQRLDRTALVEAGTVDQHQLALGVGHRPVVFERHLKAPW